MVKIAYAVGWFPAPEWQEARSRWPELAEENPEDHAEYLAAVEARLRQLPTPPGVRLRVVPIDCAGLVEYCAAVADGPSAGSGQGRAAYATELAKRMLGAAWPPERNDPCWCGSGQKYKRCCGRADDPPRPHPDQVG